MFRLPVEKLEPEMTLARPLDVPGDRDGTTLLRGSRIPPDLAAQLPARGVSEVWVHCRGLDELEALIDDELRGPSRAVYERIHSDLDALRRGAVREIRGPRLERAVDDLIDALRRLPAVAGCVEPLAGLSDDFAQHSTNVCLLALALALHFEAYVRDSLTTGHVEARDLHALGIGCLLHDVGKLAVPRGILQKRGQLTPEETALMREHPWLGFRMVDGQVPEVAADVVLRHHLHFDGTGYARGHACDGNCPVREGALSLFTRLASIADTYDAGTSWRCYAAAKPAVQMLCEIRAAADAFDPVVGAALCEVFPPFPIGSLVTLSDGHEAAVVAYDPRSPYRPRVRCVRSRRGEAMSPAEQFDVDLAETDGLRVAAIGGIDVRPFVDGAAAEKDLAAAAV